MKTKNGSKFIAFLFPLIWLSLNAPFGSAQPQSSVLELGKPIEHQIKGGETHSFTFDVKAGHYARAPPMPKESRTNRKARDMGKFWPFVAG